MLKHQREDERDRAMSLAWHIEALHRQKKLPPLEKLMTKQRARQTVGEQRAMMEMASARYGLPIRKTRLIYRPS